MKNKNRFALVITILLLVLVMAWAIFTPAPQQVATSASPVEQAEASKANVVPLDPRFNHIIPSDEPLPPTQEQMAFVSNVLLPTLEHAARTYPHQGIRSKLVRFMRRLTDGGDIKLCMSAEVNLPIMASVHKDPSGQKVLTIYVDIPMKFFAESGENVDELADEMVMTMLHEQYHVEHHLDQNTPHLQAESEAWWYALTEVFFPMVQIGRMTRTVAGTLLAVEAYTASNGDPRSPTWERFIRTHHLQIR